MSLAAICMRGLSWLGLPDKDISAIANLSDLSGSLPSNAPRKPLKLLPTALPIKSNRPRRGGLAAVCCGIELTGWLFTFIAVLLFGSFVPGKPKKVVTDFFPLPSAALTPGWVCFVWVVVMQSAARRVVVVSIKNLIRDHVGLLAGRNFVHI